MRGRRRQAQNSRRGPLTRGAKVHKPALDEMGIALYHEVKPARPGGKEAGSAGGATGTQRNHPRKPSLDEMGPGVESVRRLKASSRPALDARPAGHARRLEAARGDRGCSIEAAILVARPREGRGPSCLHPPWIPACAGMSGSWSTSDQIVTKSQ